MQSTTLYTDPHLSPLAQDDASRRGVALLIVLGLLAVMMLSAVAFSISMRIERTGAANMRHSTTANHLLETALTRAMSQIDAECGNKMFPPWESIVSTNAMDPGIPAQVLSREAMRHVPGVLRDTAESLHPDWVPIEADGRTIGRCAYMALNVSDFLDINVVGGALRELGSSPQELQLAHLAEFNQPGPASSVPADVVTAFTNSRVAHGNYETLPEARSLLTPVFGDIFDSVDRSPTTGDRDSRFTTYSRYEPVPALDKNGVLIEPFMMPTALADIESQSAEIRTKILELLKVTTPTASPNEADAVYKQLVDYLDADNVPQDLEMPSVERVPMINEVHLPNKDTAGPNNASMTVLPDGNGTTCKVEIDVHPQVELIYPFMESATEKFRVVLECVYTIDNGGSLTVGKQKSPSKTELLSPSHFLAGAYANSAIGGGYTLHTFLPVSSGMGVPPDDGRFDPILLPDVPVDVYGTTASIGLYFRVLVETEGGDIVDAAPVNPILSGPPPLAFEFNFTATIPDPAVKSTVDMTPVPDAAGYAGASYEALDPRMNGIVSVAQLNAPGGDFQSHWRRVDADPLKEPPGTLNGFNYAVQIYMARLENEFRNRDPQHKVPPMYCSNSEVLRSLGEFANLVRGIKTFQSGSENDASGYFQTFRLYDRLTDKQYKRDRVFDYFNLVDANSGSTVRRGLVNINTPDREIMLSAVLNAPTSYAPATTERVDPALAGAIVDGVLDTTYPAAGGDNFLQSMTEYGNAVRLRWRDLVPEATYSDLQRSALFTATRELFGVRNNLFLVIMRADSFTARFGMTGIRRGQVRSSTHGVALVWRDPVAVPDPNDPAKLLYYPMFRRFVGSLPN